MANDPFRTLSSTQRDSVREALDAAFGSLPIEAVTPVTGGASGASPFCVQVAGRRYLVRVEGPASPLRNPHQYVSMRIAAEAGIAPRVHYIDEVARVAIMDFIERRPLRTYPGGPRGLAHAVGTLLQRLQATPTFPRFVAYPDIVARLFAHVRRTGLFAPGVLDPHLERLERICEVYRSLSPVMVSSHNDPIPSNILFDGVRLWLIDWESAYRTDPLVDVAITLDTLAPSSELEQVLLRAWSGRVPDAALHARLGLVRALTRLYYAGVMLSASAASAWVTDDTDLSAPDLSALRQAVHEGRYQPGSAETKHVLGKMFLAAFFTGDEAPGFDFAVETDPVRQSWAAPHP